MHPVFYSVVCSLFRIMGPGDILARIILLQEVLVHLLAALPGPDCLPLVVIGAQIIGLALERDLGDPFATLFVPDRKSVV